MKMIAALIVLALGVAISLGFLLSSTVPQEPDAVTTVKSEVPSAAAQPPDEPQPLPPEQAMPAAAPEPIAIAESDWQPDPQLIAGLRESLKNGDPRAPVVGKSTPRAAPEESVLDRPDLYEDFEASEEKKLHTAFIAAAREKEVWLAEEIDKARKAGLPDEQLQEGEEKLRRIREMRATLEAGPAN